jgi:tRNA threonylcarbamoyl adenosine modification protein YeaZ
MKMMAVDTTGDGLFMALIEDGRIAARSRAARKSASAKPAKYAYGHDERLFPELRRLLARAGWELGELKAVAVSGGPGRFTGIRIGMTFGAMLARCLGCPAFAVSRFEVLAHGLGKSAGRRVCVILPAQGPAGTEFFFQIFAIGQRGARPEGDAQWAKASDLSGALRRIGAEGLPFFGPAAAEAAQACGLPADRVLHGGREGEVFFSEYAAERARSGHAGPLKPLYLKPWRGQKLAATHADH